MTSVLISGAGVAGTALAYWLARQGFTVTVVERSDGVRPGGQAVDVRGPALGVIDRMGLLDEVAARKTAIRGMSVVDADGDEIMHNTEWTVTGGTIDNPDIEILRDDLVGLLCAAAADDRGFANYQARILDYVRGNQSLAFDEDTGDPPIPEHVRYQIVNSLTLPDYPDLDSR
jgi:2-polyprenyl-6-methoxyphenol hydroxylase-like FAD-dependent oxidoreductase